MKAARPSPGIPNLNQDRAHQRVKIGARHPSGAQSQRDLLAQPRPTPAVRALPVAPRQLVAQSPRAAGDQPSALEGRDLLSVPSQVSGSKTPLFVRARPSPIPRLLGVEPSGGRFNVTRNGRFGE
jgi:hypothetical protein